MSYTAEQLSTMYCEDYDDQAGQDFKVLSCSVPGHAMLIEAVRPNLESQVFELRRKYGQNANICVYK